MGGRKLRGWVISGHSYYCESDKISVIRLLGDSRDGARAYPYTAADSSSFARVHLLDIVCVAHVRRQSYT